MYTIYHTKRFDKAYHRLEKAGVLTPAIKRDMEHAVALLSLGKQLPKELRDHALRGDLSTYRECHIRSDLLLVYQFRKEVLVLVLVDVGTHSTIFG